MRTSAVVIALLSAVGALAAGGATSQPRASLANVYSSCTQPNTVALTFDDGPYVYLYDISKALVAAGAKGTFFFNGNNYACIYDADEQKRVNFDKIHDEMWKVEQALERIAGVSPAFMRPPYGNYNNLVRQVSAQRGQSLALWDLDTGDSLGASVSEAEKVYTDAVAKKPKNILALNHEPLVNTAEVILPFAIKLLQSKGYKLVTLAECLGLPAYQWTAAPQTPDSTWHC